MRLLICLVEVGAAAFVAPVLEAWGRTPPPLEWGVIGTRPALDRLAGCISPDRIWGGPLAAEDATGGVALLRKHTPTAVLMSAGGWPLEHALVASARMAGVPIIQFIDTWYGYRRRLTVEDSVQLPDRLLLIDSRASAEAEAEGVDISNVVHVGHPAWSLIPCLPSTGGRRTLFLGAPVRDGYGQSLGYTEETCWQLVLDARSQSPELIFDLDYAPHPAQHRDDLPTDTRLVSYHFDALRDEYDQVIGIFSAPLVDAFLAGRRAISVQPNAVGQDYWALSRFGLAPRARTVEDLLHALRMPPPDPDGLRRDLCDSVDRFSSKVIELCQT